MTKGEKLDDLLKRGKRISQAKRALFEGNAYTTPLKKSKAKTYLLLKKLSNENIKKIGELFETKK